MNEFQRLFQFLEASYHRTFQPKGESAVNSVTRNYNKNCCTEQRFLAAIHSSSLSEPVKHRSPTGTESAPNRSFMNPLSLFIHLASTMTQQTEENEPSINSQTEPKALPVRNFLVRHRLPLLVSLHILIFAGVYWIAFLMRFTLESS